MQDGTIITRANFMAFFRTDEQLNTLTVDALIEIFQTILAGNSDITATLLQNLLSDYSVTNLTVKAT